MGNNLYADLLPYKDWVAFNNAQRCHELGYQNMLILLPNAFVMSLVFPRWTCALMAYYLALRISNMRGMLSHRGHNSAHLQEALLQQILLIFVVSSMVASVHLCGLSGPFVRLRQAVQLRLRPKK